MIREVTIDSANGIYVTGLTYSTNYHTTAGAFITNFVGGGDAFVTKLNSSASSLVFSTFLGGTQQDFAYSIAVDNLRNVYITGEVKSTNYPTTLGAFQVNFGGGPGNGFITKLDSSGSFLHYSSYFGGSSWDYGLRIAVNNLNQAFVVGGTESFNFPTTVGSYQNLNAGSLDVVVIRFNASGSNVIFSTLIGGTGYDYGAHIAIDSGNFSYITGRTSSLNYPTTTGSLKTFNSGMFDAFVTKLNPNGTSLVYSTYLGVNNDEYGWGVAIDQQGNAYVTGRTSSSNFQVTPGAFKTIFGGGQDIFLTKVNSSGSSIIYSTFIGGSGNDEAFDIKVNSSGHALICGWSSSNNYPISSINIQNTKSGGWDAVVSVMDSLGSSLIYSTFFGGTNDERAIGICLDLFCEVFIAGVTGSNNFSKTSGVVKPTKNNASDDAFVAKINVPGFGSSISINPNNQFTTVCLNSAIQPLTYVVVGADNIGTPINLPQGLNVTFMNNNLIITGIPSVAGTFNFTIPVFSNCAGFDTIKGLINVLDTPSFVGPFIKERFCVGVPILPLSIFTSNVNTLVNPANLPPGLVLAFNQSIITIHGTPTAAGIYIVSIPIIDTCKTTFVTFTLEIESCLNQVEYDNAIFTLFPNPTNGKITINSLVGNMFEITDLSGRVVYSFKMKADSETVELNLANGIYMIRDKSLGISKKIILLR